MEDKKAATIYTLFEDNIKDSGEDYTDDFKTALEKRYAAYKKDGKVISRKDMNK